MPCIVGIIALVAAFQLLAQAPVSQKAAPTAYTVASIQPNKSSDDHFMLRPLPGGGLTATGVTLKMFIMFAYGVASYQISGAPNWVGVERWDIVAKTIMQQRPTASRRAFLSLSLKRRSSGCSRTGFN